MLQAAIQRAKSLPNKKDTVYIIVANDERLVEVRKELTRIEPGWGSNLPLSVVSQTNRFFRYEGEGIQGVAPQDTFNDDGSVF